MNLPAASSSPELLDALRECLATDRALDGEPIDLARQRSTALQAAMLDSRLRTHDDFDWPLLLPCLTDLEPAMRLYAAQHLLAHEPRAAIAVLQDFATGHYGHGSMSIDAKETLRMHARRLRE